MAGGIAAARSGVARHQGALVGRVDELAALEQTLAELDRGRPGAIELIGEPGIGKTRLLRELAARAEARGHLVLWGSASELERDLPFSVLSNALDEYVQSLDTEQIASLGEEVCAELAHVFPSLSAVRAGSPASLQHERYRSHRAVRDLLGSPAMAKPLVLVLDDFHWADSASVELLGALLHRPPPEPVLFALGVRRHQMAERLLVTFERAHREAMLTRIEVETLSSSEARELLGEAFDDAQAAALFEESGGNPFYLEQLRRLLDRAVPAADDVLELSVAIGVPAGVVAALSEELALLTNSTRRAIEGAAVAGDPFEPELMAAAAAISEAAAMDAVDELLHVDLIRTTDVPRRFRFRHPLVRRAIYEGSPAGWRLRAHERCAAALAARGARAAARAHHIERSAREGDVAAVAVLREAAQATARLAPASAAHWLATAVRLLPQTAPPQERVQLLLGRAWALAATGSFGESREALLEGLTMAPDESIELRTELTTACARVEHLLGHYEQAHARLARALGGLPNPDRSESVALLIQLALNEFYRSKYDSMRDWGERAVRSATTLGDRPLMAAALAMPALADAMIGAGPRARTRREEAAAVVDALSDDELSRRLDSAAWLAAAELYLDLYAEADEHATRALDLARATGQRELFLVLYQILGRTWYVRGKLGEATELLDGAIESSRLSGNTQALTGNLFNRSVVAAAVGDLDIAVSAARESVDLAETLDEGVVAAWASVTLARVLYDTGQPALAVEQLLDRTGGDELTRIPGGWRASCLELLTRCWLALGRPEEARRAAASAEAKASAVQLGLASAWADRAGSTVALYDGDSLRAVELALASAAAATEVHAPIEAGLSRTLAGRALADAGERDHAITELQRAAAELDACGALRYRDAAERELGKLGLRTHRRTARGKPNGTGIEALTSRELQVARLVVDRKTNPQIAADLFLSQKTIETHLRNIFRKLDVASRVELARSVERADRAEPG